MRSTARVQHLDSGFSVCCCPSCGVQFGIPSAYLDHLKTLSDKTFWCLNGHELSVYDGHSDESERRFGEIRGENEILQAQVCAKNKALHEAQEELKILRGIAKQRRNPRPHQSDQAA